MKNSFKLVIPLLCILIFSCDPGSNNGPSCKDPKPLQPSFTQSDFVVLLGESVTFTYDGPPQPSGVRLVWERISLNAEENGDPGSSISGTNVRFTFNYVGGHTITLKAINCNDDKPEYKVVNAVVVTD